MNLIYVLRFPSTTVVEWYRNHVFNRPYAFHTLARNINYGNRFWAITFTILLLKLSIALFTTLSTCSCWTMLLSIFWYHSAFVSRLILLKLTIETQGFYKHYRFPIRQYIELFFTSCQYIIITQRAYWYNTYIVTSTFERFQQSLEPMSPYTWVNDTAILKILSSSSNYDNT